MLFVKYAPGAYSRTYGTCAFDSDIAVMNPQETVLELCSAHRSSSVRIFSDARKAITSGAHFVLRGYTGVIT